MTITDKQIKFIETLAWKKQTQEAGNGLFIGEEFHDDLPLGMALLGQVSAKTASTIIDFLITQEDKVAADAATPRQISFIASLAKKAGKEINYDGMTKQQASALINELKAA